MQTHTYLCTDVQTVSHKQTANIICSHRKYTDITEKKHTHTHTISLIEYSHSCVRACAHTHTHTHTHRGDAVGMVENDIPPPQAGLTITHKSGLTGRAKATHYIKFRHTHKKKH